MKATRSYRALPNSRLLSHRLVFFRKHGYYPPVVMHQCDNTRCINEDHLTAGTWASNNQDRAAKGRSAKRKDSTRKVSDEQAAEIRRRYSPGVGCKPNPNGPRALAREFGVDTTVIYNIVKQRTHFAN